MIATTTLEDVSFPRERALEMSVNAFTRALGPAVVLKLAAHAGKIVRDLEDVPAETAALMVAAIVVDIEVGCTP